VVHERVVDLVLAHIENPRNRVADLCRVTEDPVREALTAGDVEPQTDEALRLGVPTDIDRGLVGAGSTLFAFPGEVVETEVVAGEDPIGVDVVDDRVAGDRAGHHPVPGQVIEHRPLRGELSRRG
jgi:hypothetical protein